VDNLWITLLLTRTKSSLAWQLAAFKKKGVLAKREIVSDTDRGAASELNYDPISLEWENVAMKLRDWGLFLLLAISGICLGLSPAKAEMIPAYSYLVDVTPSLELPIGATVTGFITTDGAFGALRQTDILDWKLTITQAPVPTPAGPPLVCSTCTGSFTFLGPHSGNDSTIQLFGNSLVASSTDLAFNFDKPGGLEFGTLITPR
jgi:hypothetical protein